MSETTRPKRVVIVDAENPLEEIEGEFFWREDHDRIVSTERETAFERGYAEGFAAGRQRGRPRAVIRYRRRRLWWLLRWSLAALVSVGFLMALAQSILHS